MSGGLCLGMPRLVCAYSVWKPVFSGEEADEKAYPDRRVRRAVCGGGLGVRLGGAVGRGAREERHIDDGHRTGAV